MPPGPVIFVGPSLPDRAEAAARLPGRYLGPAAQGDLLRAAHDRPAAIVLIDGVFERVPAVHHKEILWALEEGIPVYGAASLGALRAAELAPFGMIGVGAIYEGYAAGRVERDDEVALVHGPAETGYAPLSEPLVNIRATLAAAVEEGVIGIATHDHLIASAERTFYAERGFDALLVACAADERDRFGAWLGTGRVDCKRADARDCLDRVAADLAEGRACVAAAFAFSHTDAFDQLLGAVSPRAAADGSMIAEVEALALRYDRLAHGPVAPDDLAREVTAFRERHGLADQAALQDWMAARDIDIETLSRAIEAEARIARARGAVAETTAERQQVRHELAPGG